MSIHYNTIYRRVWINQVKVFVILLYRQYCKTIPKHGEQKTCTAASAQTVNTSSACSTFSNAVFVGAEYLCTSQVCRYRQVLSTEGGSTGYGYQSCSWSADQKKKKKSLPTFAATREFGLARRVRPSSPALARSFSTLRLNLIG